MEVPDKIYVPQHNIEAGNIQELVELIVTDSIEYIRKDAILAWLQKEYDTNRWFYDTHAKPNNLHVGRCESYKQVIDKIKSL